MQEIAQNPTPEDVRAEYTALSSYATTVVTFRFTLLGFYLAATGLIIGGVLSKEKAALLLGLSVALWFMELRNRSLLANLAERGMQIEREHWGYRGKRAYEPFFSHQNKARPKDDLEAGAPPPPDYPRVWKWTVKIPISHTQAFDLTYLIVSLYAVVQLLSP